MNRNLLILLGLSAAGGLAWWYVKTKRQVDGPDPSKYTALSDNGVPIMGLDENGTANVLDEQSGETRPVPWSGPGAWDVAGTGNVVVPPSQTAAEAAQYDRAHRDACALSMWNCVRYHYDWACADVQRCQNEGWL